MSIAVSVLTSSRVARNNGGAARQESNPKSATAYSSVRWWQGYKIQSNMIRSIILMTLLLFGQILFGQKNYEPQIIILAPNNVKYDKTFENEIQNLNDKYKQNINYLELVKGLKTKEFSQQPENIQLMMRSEVEYSKNIDFIKSTSSICEQFLAYRFFEKFPNLLILLKDKKCDGKPENLKNISEDDKTQYILNFSDIEFFKENQISYAKIKSQLYDKSTNTILIDTTYVGDWNNPGFEFACNDSSLNCTVGNALSPLLENVVYTIASNNPTLKKERALRKERIEEITKKYLKKPIDKEFVENIIPKNDSTINSNSLYQTFISNDRSKFVAFYIESVNKKDFKKMTETNEDKSVNIINGKNIKDTDYLGNIPQTYAYIVKAVKYKGKWFYEKSNVTYFEPEDNEGGRLQFLDNLQDWGFFKDNSTLFNQDFWETNLFNKVKDLRKDPEWKKYGETIWRTEEEENRNYIGLYEIVANQLKSRKTTEIKTIRIN